MTAKLGMFDHLESMLLEAYFDGISEPGLFISGYDLS